jgi:hypothetical protein
MTLDVVYIGTGFFYGFRLKTKKPQTFPFLPERLQVRFSAKQQFA